MATKHFLLTDDGRIEEFSEEQAARVADGSDPLPEFADTQMRYVQVAFDPNDRDGGGIRVFTTGGIVGFDHDGRMARAESADPEAQSLSHFEHDACVQFALRDAIARQYVLN